MKKINISLIVFFLIFISCIDDDSSGTKKEVIIGKWELTELKTEILFEGSDGNEEQQEFFTTFEDCDSVPTWEFFSNGDLERRNLKFDIDDGSCSVFGLFSTDTWERIDDNTIQINEADNNETINLDVSITGNNQAELTGEQIEANKIFEFTIFMSRL